MQRLKSYFAQFDRGDWEMLGYLAIILIMVALLPIVWFWDYMHSPAFNWWLLKTKFVLTKSLENWWFQGLDIRLWLW